MTIDELAEAAIAGDALRLRQITQDWLREHPCVTDSPAPVSQDPTLRIVAAALVARATVPSQIRFHNAPPAPIVPSRIAPILAPQKPFRPR